MSLIGIAALTALVVVLLRAAFSQKLSADMHPHHRSFVWEVRSAALVAALVLGWYLNATGNVVQLAKAEYTHVAALVQHEQVALRTRPHRRAHLAQTQARTTHAAAVREAKNDHPAWRHYK